LLANPFAFSFWKGHLEMLINNTASIPDLPREISDARYEKLCSVLTFLLSITNFFSFALLAQNWIAIAVIAVLDVWVFWSMRNTTRRVRGRDSQRRIIVSYAGAIVLSVALMMYLLISVD